MRRVNFKKLQMLAREIGYSIKRTGREIEWTRNIDKNKGISYSLSDAYDDMCMDYKFRSK